MGGKSRHLTSLVRAVEAGEGSFPCVNSGVDVEFGAGVKKLPTHPAVMVVVAVTVTPRPGPLERQ